MANYPIDADHALVCGYLAGFLLREGIKVEMVYDDEGNYTDEMVLILDERMVHIKVMPGMMETWQRAQPPPESPV